MTNRIPTFLSATSATSARRGFSLVELLLAVFILAIGIISVAAIFPAGIAQQVQTKDAIYGPIVAEQAVGMLRSKLSQEDFGTFEQFGLSAGDRHLVGGGDVGDPNDRDPLLLSDAWETIPGDWGWMRPSFILPNAASLFPGITPPLITQPNALDGAIDVFSLRLTREQAFGGSGALPEQNGEADGSNLLYTSEYAKLSTSNFTGIHDADITRSTDPSVYPFNEEGNANEAELLGGIPFNRAQYAVLNPPAPTGSDYTTGDYDYRIDPGRAGRVEPLVTFTQGERSWPIGSETPEYYWDCMFRRYQGRIQVAVFVYRVGFGGSGPRSYTVNASSVDGTVDPPQQSPLPARIDFPLEQTNTLGQTFTIPRWYPEGADADDPTDDMRIPETTPQGGDSVTVGLDPYTEGWQAPGQWILDQNGTVHRVLAGRRTSGEGPVRLSQRVPKIARQASNGNVVDENNEYTDANTASAVKSIWFIPPETRDGITLIPVFVAVKDL